MGSSPVQSQLSHMFLSYITKVTLKNLGWKMIRLTAFGFGDVHGVATWMSMEVSS